MNTRTSALAQTRREYRQPLYAAYIDLKAAFDSVDRDALFKLLEIIGIPLKLIRLFRGLYTETVSCVPVWGWTESVVRGENWRSTGVHSGSGCLQRCHGQDSRSYGLWDSSGLFNRRGCLLGFWLCWWCGPTGRGVRHSYLGTVILRGGGVRAGSPY